MILRAISCLIVYLRIGNGGNGGGGGGGGNNPGGGGAISLNAGFGRGCVACDGGRGGGGGGSGGCDGGGGSGAVRFISCRNVDNDGCIGIVVLISATISSLLITFSFTIVFFFL